MGFYETRPRSRHERIGKAIYKSALYDGRGFRPDQIGIEDSKIWREIFDDIGRAAEKAIMPKHASLDT